MEDRLLGRLCFLYVVTLSCAVTGDNMMGEYVGDNHTVTPTPTTMQNIRTEQCEDCPGTSTKPHITHCTSGPPTNRITPEPSTRPIKYVVIGISGICLRMSAVFMVMLNTTNITNIWFPSPPSTSGFCINKLAGLCLTYEESSVKLCLMFSKDNSSFYLSWIFHEIQEEDGTSIRDYTSVVEMVTPLGNTFTCEEVILKVSPHVSIVFLDVQFQAFQLELDNVDEDDESTFVVNADMIPLMKTIKMIQGHWSMTRLIPSLHTVVFLVALPLNLMAIVMFLVKIKVRKPAVVYMLNLAVADLLFIAVLPFLIVYRFWGSHWLFGGQMCHFVMVIHNCNMYCSILLMTSISVDRFLAIVYPVRSLPWRTVHRAWVVCGVIWVISLASTIPLLMFDQDFISFDDIIMCSDIYYIDLIFTLFFRSYFLALISLFFFLPLVITTFCYIGAIRSLSRSRFDGSHRRSRAIYLSVIVLSVFVLCFGPTHVICLLYVVPIYEKYDTTLHIPFILSSSISSINCCLDPLIYYFASSEYQRHVYSLLRCKKDDCPSVEPKQIHQHDEQPGESTELTDHPPLADNCTRD